MVLRRLEVGEDRLQAVLDVAGEVLRERNMFYNGTSPLVRTMDGEDGPGLLYQMKVAVSADVAAGMTFEVVDRLVDRHLDVEGVAFSFVGVGK